MTKSRKNKIGFGLLTFLLTVISLGPVYAFSYGDNSYCDSDLCTYLGTNCCPAGETCKSGECVSSCVPNCQGRQCGDDGCGGSCGSCDSGQRCEVDPFHGGTRCSCNAPTPPCDAPKCLYTSCAGSETFTKTCYDGCGNEYTKSITCPRKICGIGSVCEAESGSCCPSNLGKPCGCTGTYDCSGNCKGDAKPPEYGKKCPCENNIMKCGGLQDCRIKTCVHFCPDGQVWDDDLDRCAAKEIEHGITSRSRSISYSASSRRSRAINAALTEDTLFIPSYNSRAAITYSPSSSLITTNSIRRSSVTRIDAATSKTSPYSSTVSSRNTKTPRINTRR